MDLNYYCVAVITESDSWHSEVLSRKYGVYIVYTHPA